MSLRKPGHICLTRGDGNKRWLIKRRTKCWRGLLIFQRVTEILAVNHPSDSGYRVKVVLVIVRLMTLGFLLLAINCLVKLENEYLSRLGYIAVTANRALVRTVKPPPN